MRWRLTIWTLLLSCFSLLRAQTAAKTDSQKTRLPAPEIFTSGFIDVMNNGQVNAGARFIRLNIGEPGRLVIPLSIYGGVSNNSLGSQNNGVQTIRSNEQLVNQYINPMSGLINVSVEGIRYLGKKRGLTRYGLLYQAGERILTGYRTGQASNPLTGRPSNFLNSYLVGGLYFQTGAWERGRSGEVGCFWLAARYIVCKSSPGSIREFLPDLETNGWYHGYSLGFGVEISSLVNIKAIFYKYVKEPETGYALPIYQFSFNYTVKNH